MAVTPNYGWPVPVATDYVKDGWEAISDLGNAIDTTVAGLGSGLTLVKTQAVGSAVSTVTVSDAFSATYENYRIIYVNGTSTANADTTLQLGSNTAGYYSAAVRGLFNSATIDGLSHNNQSNWRYIGQATANEDTFISFDIFNPYLAKKTTFKGGGIQFASAGNHTYGSGWHNSATSFTSFTFGLTSGTMTGGTIYVYGYEI